MSLLNDHTLDEIIDRIQRNIEWWKYVRTVVKDKKQINQVEDHLALDACMLTHFFERKKKEDAKNENS